MKLKRVTNDHENCSVERHGMGTHLWNVSSSEITKNSYLKVILDPVEYDDFRKLISGESQCIFL